jgi:cell filamentation protein
LRNIDISKGGNRFAHHSHIDSAAGAVFMQLAQERHLAGLDQAAFRDRAAYDLGELNALHPSAKATGEHTRIHQSSGARERLLHRMGNIRQADMLAAAIESFNGDTSKLAALIRQNLSAL